MTDVRAIYGSGRNGQSGPAAASERVLVDLVDRVDSLARRAGTLEVAAVPARRRIAQLREHVARHVRPRAVSLDAPLIVLLVGPTGAGKSSLFNSLIGRRGSPTGVLRPTTRELVALAKPELGDALVGDGGPLSGIEPDRLRVVLAETAPEGIVLLDAPAVHSAEPDNRHPTDRLPPARLPPCSVSA